jgi:hypothetical protein
MDGSGLKPRRTGFWIDRAAVAAAAVSVDMGSSPSGPLPATSGSCSAAEWASVPNTVTAHIEIRQFLDRPVRAS